MIPLLSAELNANGDHLIVIQRNMNRKINMECDRRVTIECNANVDVVNNNTVK
jgi:hypothetical protein